MSTEYARRHLKLLLPKWIRDLSCMRHPTFATTKIELRDSDPVDLISNRCSCVAGTAVCNHTIALLFQTAHYSELKLQVVPPLHTCTETEQQWHKPRTAGVKPGPVDKTVITRPRLNRVTEGGIRSSLYKGVVGDPLDLSLLKIGESYKDFDASERPLAASMGISDEKTLVETALGLAQKGSVLSYQQPILPTKSVKIHKDHPPYPSLPLSEYRLDPTKCVHVSSEEEHLHLKSLMVTMDIAHEIETATREQAADQEWHQLRRPRITSSRFREVCFVRGETSAEHLTERILRGTRPTGDMRRGSDMELETAREYCKIKNVNYRPCGLVIHPDAPWLGTSPDGLIFDPSAQPAFGLVEIKCPNVKNYVDCRYLQMQQGSLSIRESHAYYWQVQGQLLLTGLQWCDLVICAHEDMLVQRIYVDPKVITVIREKVDQFYFNIYMPKYLSVSRKI